MESRRIPGDGLEHEQNWIEERLIDSSNTDELAEASERLEEAVQDLQATGTGSSGQQVVAGDTAVQSNQVGGDRMATLGGDQLDPARGSSLDPDQLPPENEARARVTSHLADGAR